MNGTVANIIKVGQQEEDYKVGRVALKVINKEKRAQVVRYWTGLSNIKVHQVHIRVVDNDVDIWDNQVYIIIGIESP